MDARLTCTSTFNSFPVRELPLNAACNSDDVCADSNAACRSFRCLCLDDYFERYGVCSKLHDVIFLASLEF